MQMTPSGPTEPAGNSLLPSQRIDVVEMQRQLQSEARSAAPSDSISAVQSRTQLSETQPAALIDMMPTVRLARCRCGALFNQELHGRCNACSTSLGVYRSSAASHAASRPVLTNEIPRRYNDIAACHREQSDEETGMAIDFVGSSKKIRDRRTHSLPESSVNEPQLLDCAAAEQVPPLLQHREANCSTAAGSSSLSSDSHSRASEVADNLGASPDRSSSGEAKRSRSWAASSDRSRGSRKRERSVERTPSPIERTPSPQRRVVRRARNALFTEPPPSRPPCQSEQPACAASGRPYHGRISPAERTPSPQRPIVRRARNALFGELPRRSA